MNATALAGPPQLGRSVLVRRGQSAPSPWDACERLVVQPDAFTMEIGRRLREAWSKRIPLVVELEGDVPGGTPVWEARWWELSVGMTMRAEVLSHLLCSNVVDARDPRRARFAPVDAAVSLGAQDLRRFWRGGRRNGQRAGVVRRGTVWTRSISPMA